MLMTSPTVVSHVDMQCVILTEKAFLNQRRSLQRARGWPKLSAKLQAMNGEDRLIDEDDARQALDKVVLDLRRRPYSELRERITMKWPWIMRRGLLQGAVRRLWGLLRGRREHLMFVSGGSPEEVQVAGPSGETYDVLVSVAWANLDEDIQVTAWIDDEESEADQVAITETFLVPRVR
jgi:hypothetical protein